jgi:tetratricopeptide (TPR) repeat protein
MTSMEFYPSEKCPSKTSVLDAVAKPGSELHRNLQKVVAALDVSAVHAARTMEDRVALCMKTFRQEGVVSVDMAQSRKDLNEALKLKKEGNNLFKEGHYKEARDTYTKSLQRCPVDYDKPESNKEYAIILANRAATLEAGRMWASCLQDVQMAFKYGYPRNLHYKVNES